MLNFPENSSLLAQLVERSAFKHCSQGTEMSGVRAPYEEFSFCPLKRDHYSTQQRSPPFRIDPSTKTDASSWQHTYRSINAKSTTTTYNILQKKNVHAIFLRPHHIEYAGKGIMYPVKHLFINQYLGIMVSNGMIRIREYA